MDNGWRVQGWRGGKHRKGKAQQLVLFLVHFFFFIFFYPPLLSFFSLYFFFPHLLFALLPISPRKDSGVLGYLGLLWWRSALRIASFARGEGILYRLSGLKRGKLGCWPRLKPPFAGSPSLGDWRLGAQRNSRLIFCSDHESSGLVGSRPHGFLRAPDSRVMPGIVWLPRRWLHYSSVVSTLLPPPPHSKVWRVQQQGVCVGERKTKR